MVIYEYECEGCGNRVDRFFAIKDRKQMVKCDECGENAHRIYTTMAGYVKKTRLGDVWDKQGINPVRDGRDETTQDVNKERVKKMREENAG